MSDYNGWSNYATWRINLELLDGLEIDYSMPADLYEFAEYLKDYCEEILFSSYPQGLAMDYALAFMSDVDWRQIALNKQADLTPSDWKRISQEKINKGVTA